MDENPGSVVEVTESDSHQSSGDVISGHGSHVYASPDPFQVVTPSSSSFSTVPSLSSPSSSSSNLTSAMATSPESPESHSLDHVWALTSALALGVLIVILMAIVAVIRKKRGHKAGARDAAANSTSNTGGGGAETAQDNREGSTIPVSNSGNVAGIYHKDCYSRLGATARDPVSEHSLMYSHLKFIDDSALDSSIPLLELRLGSGGLDSASSEQNYRLAPLGSVPYSEIPPAFFTSIPLSFPKASAFQCFSNSLPESVSSPISQHCHAPVTSTSQSCDVNAGSFSNSPSVPTSSLTSHHSHTSISQ